MSPCLFWWNLAIQFYSRYYNAYTILKKSSAKYYCLTVESNHINHKYIITIWFTFFAPRIVNYYLRIKLHWIILYLFTNIIMAYSEQIWQYRVIGKILWLAHTFKKLKWTKNTAKTLSVTSTNAYSRWIGYRTCEWRIKYGKLFIYLPLKTLSYYVTILKGRTECVYILYICAV